MSVIQKLLAYALIIAVILLTGILCIVSGQALWVSIGTSLMASGLVGILELIYRRLTAQDTAVVEAILSSGLHAAHEHRSLDKYRSLVESFSILDIAGYSLRSFRESFEQTITGRLGRGSIANMRLLVVDPESQHSRNREALEGHPPGVFAKSVEDLIKAFKGQSNVEIRLYEGDLTTMIFRLDGTMFVGPEFISRASRSSMTFEVVDRKHAWLFHQFEQEFDAMWGRAKAV